MFGTFQQSQLRIEVDASAIAICEALTHPDKLQQWLWPQQLTGDFQQTLVGGETFTSQLGPLQLINHKVDLLTPTSVRFLLSGSIDGHHEWCWGDGWVQSRLEGVSLLPLNLAQTAGLLRLRLFLTQEEGDEQPPTAAAPVAAV
ncbi:MAG: hypothetical protein AAFU71_14565 [Cyanobacteria bacterium J06632_22]